MRKSFLVLLSIIYMPFICAYAIAADETGFETVSLDQIETVSGKTLMIVAYAIVFVFLTVYVWSIAKREKSILNSIAELKKTNSIKSLTEK